MLVELSVIPLGGDGRLSGPVAEVLQIIDDAGLSYQLTPSGTCIEGEWDPVMRVVKQCHERMRQRSSHVVTLIKIEDEEGATDKLRTNVESVLEKTGRS